MGTVLGFFLVGVDQLLLGAREDAVGFAWLLAYKANIIINHELCHYT
jgi:hypothetical protein